MNEEQLMEELQELKCVNGAMYFGSVDDDSCDCKTRCQNEQTFEHALNELAGYVSTKLLQAELNWLTAQIERGEGIRAKWKKLPDDELEIMLKIFPDWEAHRVTKISTIDDLLHPLIERKKEVEGIIGKTK